MCVCQGTHGRCATYGMASIAPAPPEELQSTDDKGLSEAFEAFVSYDHGMDAVGRSMKERSARVCHILSDKFFLRFAMMMMLTCSWMSMLFKRCAEAWTAATSFASFSPKNTSKGQEEEAQLA